jgi:hypothetical protein
MYRPALGEVTVVVVLLPPPVVIPLEDELSLEEVAPFDEVFPGPPIEELFVLPVELLDPLVVVVLEVWLLVVVVVVAAFLRMAASRSLFCFSKIAS